MGGAFSKVITFAFVAILGLAAPAIAESDQEDEKASQFFLQMTNLFVPGVKDAPIPITTRGIDTGYYRFVVKRTIKNDSSLIQGACKKALSAQGANSTIKNLIFKRNFDTGLTIRLPLETSSLSDSADLKNYAEVNLFRIYKDNNNKKCRISLSYFDKNDDVYYGPFVRINHALLADDQRAKLEVKPWISVGTSRSNLDNVWNIVSSAIPVIGTISSFIGGGKNEDGSDADKYQAKRFVRDTVFGLGGEVKSYNDLKRYKDIIVSPAVANYQDGLAHAPESYAFNWQLDWEDSKKNKLTFAFGYNIKIEYRGSLLMTGRQYPNFSKYKPDDFASLMNTTLPNNIIGISQNNSQNNWLTIDSAVENLAKQKSRETYDAACTPALSALNSKGFSYEDQVLIVYAIANGIARLSPYAIGELGCFADNPRAKDALARFGIVLKEKIVLLPDTSEVHWEAARDAIFKALKSPRFFESSTLESMFDDKVFVGGDPSVFKDSAGKSVFGNQIGEPVEVERDSLVEKFRSVSLFNKSGCGVPRKTDPTTMGTDRKLAPQGSGLPDAPDRWIGLLAQRGQDDVSIILIGLRGLYKDATNGDTPKITSLWAGKLWDETDPTLAAIKSQMIAFDAPNNKDGRCADPAPMFRNFLVPPTPKNPDPVTPKSELQDGAS